VGRILQFPFFPRALPWAEIFLALQAVFTGQQ